MKIIAPALALCALAACAPQEDISLQRAMAGQSQMAGGRLDRAVAAAAQHPLGSKNNPVRAQMPEGERAYLARLRCANGRAPVVQGRSNVGIGVYGNILDAYSVDCGDAAPGRVQVHMDMYHPGHVETRAVPGFTIVPGDDA